MEITNIIMRSNTDVGRSPVQSESSIDTSGRGSPVPASSQSSPATSEAQMVSISSSIDYIKQKLDAVLINYPPFFPAGHPQRLDLIKGLKGIQEKVQKSALPAEAKKRAEGTQLTSQSSDSDISAVLDNLMQLKNSLPQNATEGSSAKQPGSVVNIKI
jgi:hypothetical protein